MLLILIETNNILIRTNIIDEKLIFFLYRFIAI